MWRGLVRRGLAPNEAPVASVDSSVMGTALMPANVRVAVPSVTARASLVRKDPFVPPITGGDSAGKRMIRAEVRYAERS
jgi:hypothetical protein